MVFLACYCRSFLSIAVLVGSIIASVLLQYVPSIMSIVFERLTQESKTSELKTMCILVVSVEVWVWLVKMNGSIEMLIVGVSQLFVMLY